MEKMISVSVMLVSVLIDIKPTCVNAAVFSKFLGAAHAVQEAQCFALDLFASAFG